MRQRTFEDFPGVGEILHYREGRWAGSKGRRWLDDLAIRTLHWPQRIPVDELGIEAGEAELPFLECANDLVSFVSEKYQVASFLVLAWRTLERNADLPQLNVLVPYDHVCWTRQLVEAGDADGFIQTAEGSGNPHWMRMLLMLLRTCGAQGDRSWVPWLEGFLRNLDDEPADYPNYVLKRDGLVSLQSATHEPLLWGLISQLEKTPRLAEFEKKHFLESCGTPARAGEILFHKIVQVGYRQDIAPINIWALRFFPSPRVQALLQDLATNHRLQDIRDLARRTISA